MGMLDDAHGTLNEILQWSQRPDGPDPHDVINHLRLGAILAHLQIPDPALARLRAFLRKEALELVRNKNGVSEGEELQDALLQRFAAISAWEYVGNFHSIDLKKECADALASVRAEFPKHRRGSRARKSQAKAKPRK